MVTALWLLSEHLKDDEEVVADGRMAHILLERTIEAQEKLQVLHSKRVALAA